MPEIDLTFKILLNPVMIKILSRCHFKLLFSLIIISLLTLSGCNKKLDISNFDEEAWKADKMACENKRQSLENDLLDAKSELLGLSQQDVVGLLGKPEMQELYTRGQKFFIYHLSPGPKCQKDNVDQPTPTARLLYIRFSALNEVSEVFVK